MRKIIIKIFSFVLVFVLSILALSSCGWYPFGNPSIFPEGYTGGFGIGYGSKLEYYWVETYEECMTAIELLKSHGSTFEETAIFSYEGDLFDTKYCFKIYGSKAEYVKFGDNPYDRYAADVCVSSYAFFEDVTIEEIVYGDINNYDFCSIWAYDYFWENYSDFDITPDKLTYKKEDDSVGTYYAYYNDEKILVIGVSDNLSEKCANVIFNSVKIVGLDK